MYKPFVTGIAALTLAASLYAGNVRADEPSPYAIRPSGSKKAVPTLIQRLVEDYCASHNNPVVCRELKHDSPFTPISPEKILGEHKK